MLATESTNVQSSDTDLRPGFQSKPQKSWRILTFFKNSGLMIRFELPKQSLYFSFIDKTSATSYQSFNDGFVVKLDLFALNELVYCLSFPEPVPWEAWRDKNTGKYQLSISPFKLQNFSLSSKRTVEKDVYALKLAIYSNKEMLKQFILSPYEFELV